jgi:hypothetical protein
MEQKEEISLMKDILDVHAEVQEDGSTKQVTGVTVADIVPDRVIRVGEKFAVNRDEIIKYWVCTAQDGWPTSNYVDGLESPANYSGAFAAAEDIDGYEALTSYYSIKDVTEETKIAKGTKIAIKQGYWEYYYCIKEFNDKLPGKDKFSDYPGYFIRGLPVGDAVPCKGSWSF